VPKKQGTKNGSRKKHPAVFKTARKGKITRRPNGEGPSGNKSEGGNSNPVEQTQRKRNKTKSSSIRKERREKGGPNSKKGGKKRKHLLESDGANPEIISIGAAYKGVMNSGADHRAEAHLPGQGSDAATRDPGGPSVLCVKRAESAQKIAAGRANLGKKKAIKRETGENAMDLKCQTGGSSFLNH